MAGSAEREIVIKQASGHRDGIPFVWVASMHIGKRQEQQDAFAVDSVGLSTLAVVCDGAGGHEGGANASKAAVGAAVRVFRNSVAKSPALAGTPLEMAEEAHRAVADLDKQAGGRGPRSTLAALLLDGVVARWVHVGDSRVYHLRRGRIAARTLDHSVVQLLVRQGEIDEKEMGCHPDQGRLLRALGGGEDFKPAFGESLVEPGDAFLLCSDGFWERLRPEEIEGFFQKPSQGALDAMVMEAVRRNGPKSDNVTAVALWSTPPVPRSGSPNWPLVLCGIFLVLALASATLAIVIRPSPPPETKSKLQPEPVRIVEPAKDAPSPAPEPDKTPKDILEAYGEDENPTPSPEPSIPGPIPSPPTQPETAVGADIAAESVVVIRSDAEDAEKSPLPSPTAAPDSKGIGPVLNAPPTTPTPESKQKEVAP